MKKTLAHCVSLAVGGWTVFSALPAAAAGPSAEQALRLVPIQKDVQFDVPSDTDRPKCTIAVEKGDAASGWVVKDPGGLVLRRFVDTNMDNVVDLWCYYRNGLEIYRDVDGNYDGKAETFRWVGPDGCRWGVDADKDGKIDSWKMISAEEVTAEVVAAMTTRDEARFARLLLSPAEAAELGLGETKLTEIKTAIAALPTQFKTLLTSLKGFDPKTTEWLRFDAVRPGLLPAGVAGSTKDVLVYENVVAVVQAGAEHKMVQIGTLVRVGDVWKVASAPRIIDSSVASAAETSPFFQPDVAAATPEDAPMAPTEGAPSEMTQKLLAELDKVTQAAEQSNDPKLHAQRADLIEQLIAEAQTPEEKTAWAKQAADLISAAVQTGQYPDGIARLQALSTKMKTAGNENLAAYADFRGILADYAVTMSKPDAKFDEVQKTYIANLEAYLAKYPKSEDASDALLQVGMTYELSGEEEKAKSWYERAGNEAPTTEAGKKAIGAYKRLSSVGKPFAIKGTGLSGRPVDTTAFRGKVVLVDYWAKWCDPAINDMDALKTLHAKYGANGFAIVGVNLDNDRAVAVEFLKQARLTWDSVFAPGGLENSFATDFGILTLPTKILIDQEGNVVNRNLHISQLEDELKRLLKK
ncbi:MAG TPA: redoxin family protein [Pirellulales bacterium]